MKNIVLICTCMIASTLLHDVQAVGECYTGFAEDGLSCSATDKFHSTSIHECCVHANATGFSDTQNWIVFPEIFNRNKKVTCRTCDVTFNETSRWCFSFRNHADTTCIHIPSVSTIRVTSERDCCLWLNASGYTEEPVWQWSNGYRRWYTSCTTCFKDRFVACYNKFGENEQGDTFCDVPQARLGLNPYECCRRPNATGYAWMDLNSRRKCHPCPVDGGWSSWTPWSPCSATCGESTRRRVRSCNNPHQKYGGSSCLGNAEETEVCRVEPNCPGLESEATHRGIHHDPRGYWSQWSAISPCSATCGLGVFERRRICLTGNNPRLSCEGPDMEMHPCQNPECPTVTPPTQPAVITTEAANASSNWIWSPWSPCHSTCGLSIRSRSQTCFRPTSDPGDEPETVNRTAACPADGTEVAECEQPSCPMLHSDKQDLGITIAWSIAGAAIAALVLGAAFVVCRKQRWYERYIPRFERSARKGRHRGDLPPIPSCDPCQYCSVPDLTTRYITKPSAPDDPGQTSLDDDGYEIPKQFEDSDHGISRGSNTSVNHVYEQLDFDIGHVTRTDAVTTNGQGANKRGV